MDYGQLLNQIESNPDFSNLDYESQVEVRAKVFANKLAQDPDFVKLPEQDKDYVWQKILYRPPVYKDPQYAQATNELLQRVKQGDKKAIALAAGSVAAQQAIDNFFVTKFMDGLVTNVEKALLPLVHKYNQDVIVPSVEDKRKMAAYFDRVLNKERSTTERASLALKLFPAMKIGANLVTGAAGLIPLYSTLVGTLSAPAGLAKLGTKALDTVADRLIKTGFGMGVYKTSKVLIHGLAGGVVGMLNEGLKKAMDNKDPDWIEVQQAALKGFGPYFLGDMAMFAVGGLLKGMGQGMRKVFSKGFIKEGSKTVDEYSKSVVDALSGKIDPVMYERLRPEQKAIIDKLQRFNGIFKHVNKQTPDNLLEMASNLTDSPIEIKNGVYKLVGKSNKTFKDFAEAANFVHSKLTQVPEVKLTKENAAILGSGAKDLKLKVAIKSTLDKKSIANQALLTKLATSTNGKYTPMQVKTFSNAALRVLDTPPEIVKSLKVQPFKNKIQVFVQDKMIAEVPKVVNSAKEEVSIIQKLVKGLKEVSPEKAKEIELIAPKSLKAPSLNYSFSLLDNLAQKKFGGNLIHKDNKYLITNPRSPDNPLTFDTFEDAGNFILRKFTDETTLKLHLKYNEGLSLIKDKKTKELKLKKKGKTLGTYKDIDSLLAENPNLTPKINPQLGPKLALVKNNEIQLTYHQDTVQGNYQDILRTLNKFNSYTTKQSEISFGLGKKATITANPTAQTIELTIPEIQYRKTFSSVKEAKSFMNKGWSARENLDIISADKGYRLEISGGKYFLYGEKNTAFMASTKEELKQILDKAPIPEWAPEYSGLDENIINTLKKPPTEMFKPTELTLKSERLDPLTTISHSYRPPDAWFVSAIEHGGDENILKYFRQIDSTLQFLTAEEGKVAKELVGLWKGYKREKRVKIGELLEIPESEWGAAAKERLLSDGDVAVAKAMRTFFDTAKVRFQVDYNTVIQDYLPRMRKTYLKDPAKYRSDSSMQAFLADSFGGRVPRDLDAFFKHQRVSDVVRFIREDDPLTLALKYNAIGQRETFLAPLWREADNYLKGKGKALDPVLVNRFNAYRADVMGIPTGMGEKALVEFSKRFYQGLKGTNIAPGLASDLTKAMMSWGYLSAMGFRLWLPIRNMFQVWTTLAPRIGNSWVSEAINTVSKDSKGAIFQMLKNRGIITENLPLYGANIIEGEQALSRLLHKGLKWYKNSDEWTRAVAYVSSQLRFRDAVKRFSKGFIKDDKFMELSGLGMLPHDLKNEALSFIRAGKWSSAEDTFARAITSDTMFSYRAGMAPTSFRGAVGKLFGMMGHYPVYYLENVKRALKYSTTGQKIAYASRFLGNSFALYYSFKNVLGINATNFLPWTPSMFSGGPYYQLMNEALMSVGKGYQSREARAKLFGIKHKNGKLFIDLSHAELTRWGIPMGFLAHNIAQGLEHLNNDEYYLAFLSFTTAPINPDLLQ